VFATQPGLVGGVRLEPPKIRDRRRQAGTVEQMARGMTIAAGAAIPQAEIDHCSQRQRCREGMLSGKRIGGSGQDLVMVSVQFVRALQNKVRRPIQSWPRDKE
jgi:hypothetical protein